MTRRRAERDREASLRAMADGPLDLVVVGGGITGAGVARDAALRGLAVALVEKEDFGFGTSSRSSKIIHGGVRYLENFHFRLVRESARERAVLRAIAPHLVHRIPFHYPVFRGESYWKIRLGLRLFDFLAGARGNERSVALGPEETRTALPGLRDPLVGSVRYPEFITDDARFTLENALSASDHGALVANYARVSAVLRDGERVCGVAVEDRLTGEVREVRARSVVNAAGPWAEAIAGEAGEAEAARIVPSKGSHILLPAQRLPLRAATFLRSRAGRSGLAMRRGPWVYVGTSDEEYDGDLDRVRAERDEVDELLEMMRDCFPSAELGPDDVKASWAGIRPLIREEGKSTRDMSRKDEVWNHPPGMVTVAGGKLTTYRRMAERTLDAVGGALDAPLPGGGASRHVPLPGAADGGERPLAEEDVDRLRDRELGRLAEMRVAPEALERLGWLYGTQLSRLRVMGEEDPGWVRPLASGVPAVRGEVRLAVEEEMARTLADFMDRRSALLLFGPDHGLAGAEEASRILASLLEWSDERRRSEVEAYRVLAREHDLPSR